jgi:periplasmic protein TonB
MWSSRVASGGVLQLDNPWHRLPWVLPCALLIWATMLWLAGIYLKHLQQNLTEVKPIEAQLIKKRIIVKPKIPRPVIERKPPPPEPPPPQPRLQSETPPVQQQPPKPAPVVEPRSTIGGGNTGARAIFQPKPEIPDELREEAIKTIAVARFHVAPDGSATVELIKPTPDPRINQLLLNTLKRWRFFPALADGKPVASTQDLRIHLEIK